MCNHVTKTLLITIPPPKKNTWSPVNKNNNHFVCLCVCVNPRLLKPSLKEKSLYFHADLCLFLRGQPFKHFQKAHEVVFVAVLWFFRVCRNSLFIFRRVCAPLRHPCSVTLVWLGDDGRTWLAAAFSTVLVVLILDDDYSATVICVLLWGKHIFLNNKLWGSKTIHIT